MGVGWGEAGDISNRSIEDNHIYLFNGVLNVLAISAKIGEGN